MATMPHNNTNYSPPLNEPQLFHFQRTKPCPRLSFLSLSFQIDSLKQPTMGGGQPYLYGAPSRYNEWDPYNGFNPKAVSQASLASKPRVPKQDGPLINFNRHPDSYLVPPSGKTDVKPMHPSTKSQVVWVRRTQLAFRCLQLIASIGLLVAIICIKSTKNTEWYIIRLPVSHGFNQKNIFQTNVLNSLLLTLSSLCMESITLSDEQKIALLGTLQPTISSPFSWMLA